MNIEHLEDLPNINKNIENQIKTLSNNNLNENNDLNEEDLTNLKKYTKSFCSENIDSIEKSLKENNSHLKDSISKKEKEISTNIDNFIKKIEQDTIEHINNLEKSNLTEIEKQIQYQKCIDQLDSILSLNEIFERCIEKSEDNLLNFLEKSISSNKDPISFYLDKKEDDLNDSNIYNYIKNEHNFSEKLYNNIKTNYLKNYIINSNILKNENIKLKKLKIDNFSDVGSAKEILVNIDFENKLIQNQIEKISINNISQNDFKYLFYKMKIAKKSPIKNNNPELRKLNLRDERASFIDNENPNQSKIILNKEVKNKEGFIIIDEKKNEDKDDYIETVNNYKYISIKNCDLTDLDLGKIFPELKILKLNSCQISFEFNNIINNSFNNLTELYLDGCNLVNENFNEINFSILKNETLRKNLKLFSARNNYLSVINMYKYVFFGEIKKSYSFENLEFLDFSNNKINIFDSISINGLPKINVIDLSNNYIQSPNDISFIYEKYKNYLKQLSKKQKEENEQEKKEETTEEKKEVEESSINKEKNTNSEGNKSEEIERFFLLSNNNCLLKSGQKEKYFNYLIWIFPKLNYSFKRINFSGLFYGNKYHKYLSKIDLIKFQSSLIEIDLSMCSITDDELSELLLNQFCLINIKKINLSNNQLTDALFSKLINNKSYDIYNRIKYIDISNNNFDFFKVDEIKKFIKLFDSIQTVIIKNTPAEESINNFIKKSIIIFNENKNGQQKKTEYGSFDLLIKVLFDFENKNNKETDLSNNSHIKIIMKNTIDYKFIEAAMKIYPHLFEKINIEYKFKGPN